MKSAVSTSVLIALLTWSAAAVALDDGVSRDKDLARMRENVDEGAMCIIVGSPPADVKFKVVRQLKKGKSSYGRVVSMLADIAREAKRDGADAIINYTGDQKFGLLPWRLSRPVVTGTAVRWSGGREFVCASVGGVTLQQILDSGILPDESAR